MDALSARILNVTFRIVDPHSSDAVTAMTSYFDELEATFPKGFDPGDALGVGAELMRLPEGAFVVAYRADGQSLACGGIQKHDATTAEIKRMWVSPDGRGQGLGHRLLTYLEAVIEDLGYNAVVLDTNSTLTTAISMYERAGYTSIERYNENPYAERWFHKDLTPT